MPVKSDAAGGGDQSANTATTSTLHRVLNPVAAAAPLHGRLTDAIYGSTIMHKFGFINIYIDIYVYMYIFFYLFVGG